jgi:NAD(P)-dependent dehydrogenase (short-subunit alcohol dehydrogenase family)
MTTTSKPVAIVTGSASGIGRQMTRALHGLGYRLVVTDIDRSSLERVALEEEWISNADVMIETLDVRDDKRWDSIVEMTVGRFGRLDLLLNIAGFLRPGYVHEVGAEVLDLHVDVNAKGVMYGTRAAARHMIRQRAGHIVNVASIAGISHVPGLSAYCASKHAVRGFSLSVAHELSQHGISVTVFCPDAVETPMLTLQEGYPEAAMTFGSRRALTLAEVEAALLGALVDRPLELVLDVPLSFRAIGAKLANLFPSLTALAAPHIVRTGRALQERRMRDVSKID